LSGDARPPPARRLFFALWPDEPQRAALVRATAKAVKSCGGRPVPAANLHVTLAFIGSVPEPRLTELQILARRVAAACPQDAPLMLCFAEIAHWTRAQILCALAAEVSAGARTLSAGFKDAAAAAGFTPDLKPFQAHVTVARKVLHAPRRPALRPLTWCFDAFALVDSRTESTGPVYSVVESYPLVKAQKVRE
jgi:RNA 2',3'-cyclic 3'-phosphodiesterase